MKQIAIFVFACFSMATQATKVHVIAEKDEQDFEVAPAILASSPVWQNMIALSKGERVPLLDLRTIICHVHVFHNWVKLYSSPQYLSDLKSYHLAELAQLVALSHFFDIAEVTSDGIARPHPLHPRQLFSWIYNSWLTPEERGLFPSDLMALYIKGYFTYNAARLSEAMQRWAGRLSASDESTDKRVEDICQLLDRIEGFLWLHVDERQQAWVVRRHASHKVDVWYVQPDGSLIKQHAFFTEVTPVISPDGHFIINERVEDSQIPHRDNYCLAAYAWQPRVGSSAPALRLLWRKRTMRLGPFHVTDDGKFIVGYWPEKSTLCVLTAASGRLVQFQSVKHLTELRAPDMASTGAWQATFTYDHEEVNFFVIRRSKKIGAMAWDPAAKPRRRKPDEQRGTCVMM